MSDCAPLQASELANSVAGRSSLHRMVRLRWERLADGYYKAGRYSAIRIRNRYSFRVDGASVATGLTLNQCKLEAMRREQPNSALCDGAKGNDEKHK